MGSGNEPAGQQAMTSERLAWVLEHIATIPAGREHTFVPVADLQMLRAEVERLRARDAAQEAREAALVAMLQRLVSDADATYVDVRPYAGLGHTKIVGPFPSTLEQARALLAATAAGEPEKASGGDGA